MRGTPDRPLDERGVSEILGAILVFALFVAVLVLLQANAVPAENAQIEFEHSQRAQGDIQTLDSNVDRTAAFGTTGSVGIEAGVRYPTRLLLFNPGPVTGTLRTTDGGAVALGNLEAVDPETRQYLQPGVDPFPTRTLSYRASYNVYDDAPTTRLQTGVLFNRFPSGGTTVLDEGDLVTGRRISLVTLAGNLSTTRSGTVTLSTIPLSAPTQRVPVRGANGNPITIDVPTNLSERTWRQDLLAAEYDPAADPGNDRYVQSVDCQSGAPETEPCDGLMRITLEPGVTYELAMAKVGVANDGETPGPYYVTPLTGTNTVIESGDADELVVQVRDRYNNPVSGVEVTFTTQAAAGTFLRNDASQITVETDENGRAAAVFRAAADFSGPANVTASAGDLSDDGTTVDDYELATFDGLVVEDPDADDPEPGINPFDRRGSLVLFDVEQLDASTFRLEFTNIGQNTTQTLTDARLNFYYSSRQGDPAKAPVPVTARFEGSLLRIRGPYENVPDVTVGPGNSTNVTVRFYDNSSGTSLYDNINSDDFFVLSAVVNGETSSYFVAPGGSLVEPNALYTYSPATPTNQTAVSFDATGSNDPDGSIVSYQWDFDDGSTATGAQPTHTFAAGTYDVTLTVTDGDGLTDTATKTITVTGGANAPTQPTASLSISRSGNTYTLDASGSSVASGSIVEYRFDANGDGDFDDPKDVASTTSPSVTVSYTGQSKPTNARVVVVTDANQTDTATAAYP